MSPTKRRSRLARRPDTRASREGSRRRSPAPPSASKGRNHGRSPPRIWPRPAAPPSSHRRGLRCRFRTTPPRAFAPRRRHGRQHVGLLGGLHHLHRGLDGPPGRPSPAPIPARPPTTRAAGEGNRAGGLDRPPLQGRNHADCTPDNLAATGTAASSPRRDSRSPRGQHHHALQGDRHGVSGKRLAVLRRLTSPTRRTPPRPRRPSSRHRAGSPANDNAPRLKGTARALDGPAVRRRNDRRLHRRESGRHGDRRGACRHRPRGLGCGQLHHPLPRHRHGRRGQHFRLLRRLDHLHRRLCSPRATDHDRHGSGLPRQRQLSEVKGAAAGRLHRRPLRGPDGGGLHSSNTRLHRHRDGVRSGFSVSVADNSTTRFRALATDDAGTPPHAPRVRASTSRTRSRRQGRRSTASTRARPPTKRPPR